MTMIKMTATSTQIHHGAFMGNTYPTSLTSNARFGRGLRFAYSFAHVVL
jgi:hypothetical protein